MVDTIDATHNAGVNCDALIRKGIHLSTSVLAQIKNEKPRLTLLEIAELDYLEDVDKLEIFDKFLPLREKRLICCKLIKLCVDELKENDRIAGVLTVAQEILEVIENWLHRNTTQKPVLEKLTQYKFNRYKTEPLDTQSIYEAARLAAYGALKSVALLCATAACFEFNGDFDVSIADYLEIICDHTLFMDTPVQYT